MKIHALHLWTARLAEMEAFYSAVLGLPVLHQDAATVSYQAGSTRLAFESTDHDSPTYHFAFNIPRNKFPEAKAWLAARVPSIRRDDEDEFRSESWKARFMYFHDPAGNVVEFIARQTLDTDTTGPFGPQGVLSVSEIGLPAEDVAVTVATLTKALGIVPYGQQADDFAALGDEHGLFIVVKEGRNWFPTTLPARAVPMHATIEGPTGTLCHVRQTPDAVEIEAGTAVS